MIVRWLLGDAHERLVAAALEEIKRATRVDDEDRAARWDACWSQVQADYHAGKNPELVPPYLRQTIARIGGAYAQVKPEFFPNFQRTLVAALARKYFPNEVIEIGCGGGFNLLTLSSPFIARGYDRSHAAIVCAQNAELYARWCGDLRSDCSLLDFPPGAGILTVGCMEQLGHHWRALFERLVRHDGPIVHIEPLLELYRTEDAADRLAQAYHQARGYLSGYLPMLWHDPRVKVIEQQRLRIGSAWNDGFSYVVWRRA